MISGKLPMLAALLGLATIGYSGHAETIPPATALPVTFTQTLEAGKVRPGAIVIAKTTEPVFLPGGQALPDGTTLIGHVVESTPFRFNPAPYAVQTPSTLAIHFDKIARPGDSIPVNLAARAVAGPVAAHEASIPHYRDETDTTGTRILIGGSYFSPIGNKVFSPAGDIVGYNRATGVYARLLPGGYVAANSTIRCGASETEQPVGIFSANACGVYSLDEASMLDNGSGGEGTFVLESSRQTVELYAGSAALLEATAPH